MKKLNNRGFTFVEVIVAASVLGLCALYALKLQDSVSDKVTDTSQDLQLSNMIFEISQDIRNNIGLYQVSHYGEFSSDDDYLNQLDLPMAWKTVGSSQAQQDLVPVESCLAACPAGRLGFRIVPVNGYNGFYTVYIVYENNELFKGRKLAKFFVKGK